MIYAKKERIPREEVVLGLLKEKDDFMEMARQIVGLIKDLGCTPTPRQMKKFLGIDAKKMRSVCSGVGTDPYDYLMKAAKQILLKEDGLIVGFGCLEEAPKGLEKA